MRKMKPEQRKDELLQGLKATGSDVVYLAIDQVAEVLGIEKAVELHVPGTLVESQEATHFKRHEGAKVVARKEVHGTAEFDRTSLLEALEAHKFEEAPKQEPVVPAKRVDVEVPDPEDYDPAQEDPEA